MRIKTPVLILGWFGKGNFGDDLLLRADLAIVRRIYSDRQISVRLHGDPLRYCHRMVPGPRYLRFNGVTRAQGLAVLYGGGTQFFSFAPAPAQARNRRSRLRRFVYRAAATVRNPRRLLRRPVTLEISPSVRVAGVSLGLGPFHDAGAEELARRRMSRCGFIWVRDRVSHDYCRQWGLNYARLWPDLGYAPLLWGGADASASRSDRLRQVGFVIQHWTHGPSGAAHLAASFRLARELVRRKLTVRFFTLMDRMDSPAADAARAAGFDVLAYHPVRLSVRDFAARMCECDLIFSARAHGTIVSVSMGVPAVSMLISPKMAVTAESLGDVGYKWDQPFELGQALELVTNIIDHYPAVRQATLRRSRENASLAAQGAQELERFLRAARAGTEYVAR